MSQQNLNLTCPITHEYFEEPISSPCCGNMFSKPALVEWLEINPICPFCKVNISYFNASNAPVNKNVADMIEQIHNANLPKPNTDKWEAKISKLDNINVGKLEITNTGKVYKNLVLAVIDKSGSMSGSPMNQVKYSLKGITNLSIQNKNLKTVIVTYNDYASSLEIDNTLDREHYDHVFSSLYAGGGTSFTSAFVEIVKLANQYANDNDFACMTILFLTDGQDSVSASLRHTLVEKLKNDLSVWKKKYTVHTIGFGPSHDSNFLNLLRMIGTEEGAYRFADPNENDDILSGKIRSIFDVIASSVALPINITSDFKILNGDNGTYWIELPGDINVVKFTLENKEIMVVPEIVEADLF